MIDFILNLEEEKENLKHIYQIHWDEQEQPYVFSWIKEKYNNSKDTKYYSIWINFLLSSSRIIEAYSLCKVLQNIFRML